MQYTRHMYSSFPYHLKLFAIKPNKTIFGLTWDDWDFFFKKKTYENLNPKKWRGAGLAWEEGGWVGSSSCEALPSCLLVFLKKFVFKIIQYLLNVSSFLIQQKTSRIVFKQPFCLIAFTYSARQPYRVPLVTKRRVWESRERSKANFCKCLQPT